MELREIRKAKKVKIREIGLNARTVKSIEDGNEGVSLRVLKTYLAAVGLRISYSLR